MKVFAILSLLAHAEAITCKGTQKRCRPGNCDHGKSCTITNIGDGKCQNKKCFITCPSLVGANAICGQCNGNDGEFCLSTNNFKSRSATKGGAANGGVCRGGKCIKNCEGNNEVREGVCQCSKHASGRTSNYFIPCGENENGTLCSAHDSSGNLFDGQCKDGYCEVVSCDGVNPSGSAFCRCKDIKMCAPAECIQIIKAEEDRKKAEA